jgi:lipopolysaccharide export system permease protein
MNVVNLNLRKLHQIPILTRYLVVAFLVSFLGTLCALCSLFLVFDLFDRVRIFIREDSSIFQIIQYFFLKIPSIIQLTTPIALLIATLISVGKLSQQSEITAMRANGLSIISISRPLIILGLAISLITFILGETITPKATRLLEELYHLDIKKKAEKGSFSRENFWYRAGNNFYNISYYDSRTARVSGLSALEFTPNFELQRRIFSPVVTWESSAVGWTMRDVTEISFDDTNKMALSRFRKLPLVIAEKPKDFYNMQRTPETMTYLELSDYIHKLSSEGVPVTKYQVDLASKLSFPLINLIVILIALPFAINSSRSKTSTKSIIYGLTLGFSYYFCHAFCSALGGAELLPLYTSAWAANILFGSLGAFMLFGAEFKD